MVRRSVLFSPGDRPEMLRKAPETGADVVVFDLEDAVSPERKDEARETIQNVLTDDDFDPACEVCVRVNPVGAGATTDVELALAGAPTVQSVMLPKASSADDVDSLSHLLAEHNCDVPILPLVESSRGVLNASEIADADASDALVFGAEDLSADIGATRTADGTEVLYARQHVVLAASAAGVDAIDTVYTDITDTDGLATATTVATELGYDGKMAIHPTQVSVINNSFTPDESDVEWAERVLAAKRDADAKGRGVFRVDDEMIDAPLISQAERIMERASAGTEDTSGQKSN